MPVDGFTHGLLTPATAFVMAAVGSALGLRCTMRALTVEPARRAGWLLLGAVAIGTGIFTMHFIAMMGFTADSVHINYDVPITLASLGVAIVVVGIGVFTVGYLGRTAFALTTGGIVTGLGVAAMHYLGMAGMKMDRGRLVYDGTVVALSVLIAVVAATAALWLSMTVKRFGVAVGAALIMGVAVSGMHYTGMAALEVHAHAATTVADGKSPAEILAPILIGPVLLLVFVGLFVGMDPLENEWRVSVADEGIVGGDAAAPEPAGSGAAAYFERGGGRRPGGV
ncbi:membrane protein [Streptomyces sp. CNQ-509]|uniref:MHYT domain-containing protein n=1 Tax=Streptomyces sp. CNQ-509 TaxID=444103 RepID=UPI00062DFE78|nr:MHYT domain-containing protein [Streptomyces sp. CNQ-509]AKH86569.1 membrane protein [Streptomyces sp. CNQ-509]